MKPSEITQPGLYWSYGISAIDEWTVVEVTGGRSEGGESPFTVFTIGLEDWQDLLSLPDDVVFIGPLAPPTLPA